MLYELWERHRRLIVLLCLVACAALGLLFYRPPAMDQTPLPLETPAYASESVGQSEPASAGEAQLPANMMYVDVKGSVKHPGVYPFTPNERVKDAVTRAGGFLPQADGERINLAQPLTDGMVVWVPAKGKGGSPCDPPAPAALPALPSPAPADGQKINLNTATLEQLMTLPGIGESRAREILAYREKHGPFRTPSDLKKVSGIGDKMFERIRDRIAAP